MIARILDEAGELGLALYTFVALVGVCAIGFLLVLGVASLLRWFEVAL